MVLENKLKITDSAELARQEEKISKKILCLPLYDSLSLDDVNDICDIIINYKGEMDNA